MSVYSVMEQVTTLAGIPLAIIGFGIAFWQIAKTRSAAEAAAEAAQAAAEGLSRSNLLILLPQLVRAEDELHRAVMTGSVDLAIAWLGTWRWQAGQVRGYLVSTAAGDKKVLKALQTSVSAAASAKAELTESESCDMALATKRVREAIAAVTDELGVVAAVHAARAGGAGSV